MAIDLFELRAYTEGVDVGDLRLVHRSDGSPGWGLMRLRDGRLTDYRSVEAEDRGDAIRIIEAVGLMPLGEEVPADEGGSDIILTLQPGSEETPDETPV